MSVEERFLKYVKIDTQSDPNSSTIPSSMKQKDLGKILVDELHELGIHNAMMDEAGSVYAFIEANCENQDAIGFIAHMDTASDCSGKNVNPKIIHNYQGETIVLNEEKKVNLDPKMFPNLIKYLNEDLIVTDGTTLLGADDKAGVAEIMTMAETLMRHQEIKHGKICIAFTCDEEVGRGTEQFDLQRFDCEYAYTVDGGDVEAIDYENFNAASADVWVHGQSIHPGEAKGKMINAILVAYEFHNCLPVFDNPACTEGYEGFNHMTDLNGKVEEAHMQYIIRNHDETLFAKQKQDFRNAQAFLNKKYGYEIIELQIKEQYANMRSIIEKDMRCVKRVQKAMSYLKMNYQTNAIRGGTDGAMLTYKGLNTPNLGTGGENFHGKYEYISINQMHKAVELLVEIAKAVD